MSKSKKQSYDGAMEELQTLVDELQSNSIGIDELGKKIARAKELILFCREKLRTTEEEIGGLFE